MYFINVVMKYICTDKTIYYIIDDKSNKEAMVIPKEHCINGHNKNVDQDISKPLNSTTRLKYNAV